MNPGLDTLGALIKLAPAEVAAWLLFAVFPYIVLSGYVAFRRKALQRRLRFVLATSAQIFGYPTGLLLVVGVPWFVFELFFAHVLYEAYPVWRPAISAFGELSRGIVAAAFWVVPLLWPLWVLAVVVRCGRVWQSTAWKLTPPSSGQTQATLESAAHVER